MLILVEAHLVNIKKLDMMQRRERKENTRKNINYFKQIKKIEIKQQIILKENHNQHLTTCNQHWTELKLGLNRAISVELYIVIEVRNNLVMNRRMSKIFQRHLPLT